MNNQLVSSSSFSSPPSWEYDVFLSFRGKDTRTNFTDHFYKALDNKGITTFIDHQLKRGEEISQALLEAIDESRISIIIFSKNYASSRWCLEELVHILECRKSRKQIVLPVFYKVDPSDVRKQTSSFGDAFTELKCRFENNKEKIHAWRSALTHAANLSGYTFKEGEYEATFISKILKEILVLVLQRTHLHVANHPIGLESCVKEVEELLGVGGNDPCVVGIWGASGIGKTTVAKAIYNAIAYKFEGSCFLADVRETSMQYRGLLNLQKILLSKISGSKWKVDNPHQGNSHIEKLLRRKKILLILDDVDDLEQLNNLVQFKWLSEGSRVIITTKNRGLLKSYDVELIYEVQMLEDDKALELLSLNAFGKKEPSDDYLGLARRAIAYAQGHPLAINLIGSYLRNKSLDRWHSMLDSYDSYRGEPYTGIQRILRKSYDAWDYVVQQVFLDIACFFKGEDKDNVLQILRSLNLYVPPDCLEELVEKAIITIEDNKILMHDLLEKMGKRIVYEESPNEPGERSRLWHHEDVYRVLTENRGTEKIKGIVVKLPKPYVIPLNAKSFFEMVNLKIFISCNAHFSGCVKYLPNDLRWIDLWGIDLRAIEFGRDEIQGWGSNILQKHILTFNLQSNCHLRHLVTFIMPNSDVRQLKVFQESSLCSQLQVMYPGDEIPKRFSYNSKHLTATRIESMPYHGRQQLYSGGSEFSFEIPLNLQERETLLGLAFSCVFQSWPFLELGYYHGSRVRIFQPRPLLELGYDNEASDYQEFEWLGRCTETDHVGLKLVDLEKKQGDICKVKFQIRAGTHIKICGVHPLFRKEHEWLPLSLGPTSSLGSTDIVDDEYDWKQQWPSLSLNPTDDHPKRTQIDHNVPSDIEEEQEQPSTISWGARIKSCGVHPVLRKEDEWLPLSLGPTSSLGKRPRPLGSSDTVHEEYDRQRQWLSLSSNPADEQEQPSTSDDSQFFLH